MLSVRRLVVGLVSTSALLTLAACSAASEAEVGSSSAAFATCEDPTARPTRPVTLDVDALAKLRCGRVMGWILLELDWEHDFYWDPVNVSSDTTECVTVRDEILALARSQQGLSGVVTEQCHFDENGYVFITRALDLENGRWTLGSRSP